MPLSKETAAELERMRLRLLEMLAPLQRERPSPEDRAEGSPDPDEQALRQSLWSAVHALEPLFRNERAPVNLDLDQNGEAEKLGDRIGRLRRALDLSQSDLAARVGCKPSQISKYERNAYEPSLATLAHLAAVFGTSTDYLLTGREAPHAGPDRLTTLRPLLERLPRELRNEIADFLSTVLRAASHLGLNELV